MSEHAQSDILGLTAQIVSAHVANNKVETDALSGLIASVYRSLVTTTEPVAAALVEPPAPAVPVRRSVFPDYIVCLEDGKKLKMLKRHLQTSYGLTPAAYRAKWNLPHDYPMVAPNYAAKRSDLARKIGLGRKLAVDVETADTGPAVTHVPARRARGSKG